MFRYAACAALSLTLLIGCSSSTESDATGRAETQRPAGARQDAQPRVAVPGVGAERPAVAAYLQGRWRIALLPEGREAADLAGPTVEAVWTTTTDSFEGNVGGVPTTGGRLFVPADKSPRVQFETTSLTFSQAGGDVTVDGPIRWDATLREDGTLVGTAAGPDRRAGRWEATRQ